MEEFGTMVDDGKITDAPTIAAWALAVRKGFLG